MKNFQLTNQEYNVLNKITRLTKTDCWFWIETENGKDTIYDLENNQTMSWEDGLTQLNEAIEGNEENINISKEEWNVYYNLLKKFNI